MKGSWLSAKTPVVTQPGSAWGRTAAALSLVSAVVVTVSGCGGGNSGSTTPTAPTPTSPAIGPTFVASGDSWDFRAAGFEEGPIVLHTGYNPGPRFAAMNGALDISGSSVTAVLAVWGGCINDNVARFTGTRNGTDLAMVSAPVAGVTIRVTGTLSADMRSFSGAYSADGGCASTERQLITGQRAEIDGVWSDTDITLTIAAATVPNDAKGSFTLRGSAVFANNSCAPDATVGNGTRGRLVFADVKNGSNLYLMDGEVTSDFKQMRYVCWLSQGSCPGQTFYEGTLTRR